MPPTDQYVAEARFHVRYAETDAMGIVHHASFIVYMEEARSHYARARNADYAKLIEHGYHLVVAEVHARYTVPARYGQELITFCWIEEFKSRGLTFAYEIVDSVSKVTHVTGHTRHICVTLDGQVARIPDSWLNILRP